MALPDFFIIGAPKAGTTALHAALVPHPELFLSPVKETKYFLCDGTPPPRRTQRGPGDAHSAQEWIWRRSHFESLFDAAPPGTLRGESSPFYLYDRGARERLARDVPQAKLVAILRDPVDRAYSNWMHLWSDGLEPVPDFLQACRREDERIAAGWAPFWHYRRTGLYGEQLAHLYELFPRTQVHVIRYRDLVDRPSETIDGVCEFLGVSPGVTVQVRPENVKPFVPDNPRTARLAKAVRAGAWAGSFLPPQAWRRASVPLLAALHRDGVQRPVLSPEDRAQALDGYSGDIALLERLTGDDFSAWLRHDRALGQFGAGQRSAD